MCLIFHLRVVDLSEGVECVLLGGQVGHDVVDDVGDLRVGGVSEARPLGERPLEGLNDPVVPHGRIAVRGGHVVVLEGSVGKGGMGLHFREKVSL